MKHFADELTQRISKLENPTVVGLDPHYDHIPDFLKQDAIRRHGDTPQAAAEAILQFNHGIIDAIADVVPAVKPQIAFYEKWGFEGFRAYEETVRYAHKKGLLVIGDIKRGDIDSTAAAYAQAHLSDPINSDAVTVNPFLGSDSITPFTKIGKELGRGIFVLVRTSNPSSDEIQSLTVGDQLFDEYLAGLVEGWGRDLIGESGFSLVGAVVGGTYPEEARSLRNLMPNQIFLVPGYGAQGASVEDIKPCFYKNGTGAIVNSSRGIIFAYEKAKKKPEAYADEARKAALAMKEELKTIL